MQIVAPAAPSGTTTWRGLGLTAAGRAWLAAYQLARFLGFTDDQAQGQAFAAADAVQGARPC